MKFESKLDTRFGTLVFIILKMKFKQMRYFLKELRENFNDFEREFTQVFGKFEKGGESTKITHEN